MKKNPPPGYEIVWSGIAWRIKSSYISPIRYSFYWTACNAAWRRYFDNREEELVKELTR